MGLLEKEEERRGGGWVGRAKEKRMLSYDALSLPFSLGNGVLGIEHSL